MNDAIVVTHPGALAQVNDGMTNEQIDLLKRTICVGATVAGD